MSAKYLFYSLLAVFIWGGNTIVNKLAAGAIPPGIIAFERWVIAFLILSPFVLKDVVRHRDAIRSQIWKLAILGLLGMAICQGVGYYAAGYTSATNMAILLALVPLFTLLISTVYLRELPSFSTVAGVLVSLAGIVIVLGKGSPAALFSGGVSKGDGLMLLVVLALAFYGILLKKWSGSVPPFVSLYLQIGWAVVFLLPGYLLESNAPFTLSNISMILYAAIPGSIIAPFVWMQAVSHLGAARISIFMNLIPVITAAIATVFLGEHLHAYLIFGGGLTIAGIILSQKRKARKRSSVM
ncbi:DMT family transporter [Kosakonia oryzendophytica]|uniref:DMT family transporter n=1 Tax=Kosakonia oryzendophytica TaxID=1005665 RepID=UPI003D354FB4